MRRHHINFLLKFYKPTSRHLYTLRDNKNLNAGDFLIDDRTANGAGEFNGEHIHFLSEQFKNWNDVLNYLIPKHSVIVE
tara:strand:- start:1251 stop:1487 length:237 start_codon:yes stop_codon:yes gene_type:complete